MSCLFCDIVAHQRPASVVYEDDIAMIFMDLFPIREGHVLIIPKIHAQYVEALDPSVANHLLQLASRVLRAQGAAGIQADANNLLINNGKAANQHVPHVHLHVIPRRRGDSLSRGVVMVTRFLRVLGMKRRREHLNQQAARLAWALQQVD